MLRMDRTLDFSKIGDAIDPPGLVQIQTASYDRFLQADVSPQRRKNAGLEALLREIFPIISYDSKASLEYVGYELGEPRYTPEECRQLRLTYGRPFRMRCRLKHKDIKGVLEESIYMGDMPVMIGGGEFIVNGAERVIVSQLHRSPGVDFTVEFAESDRPLHGARIIPERGSWIEMGVTKKEVLAIRIDQSSKFPITTFLRAMNEDYGTTEAILRLFYQTEKISPADAREHMYAVEPIINPKDGEILVEASHQFGDAATTIQAACSKKIEVINKPSDELLLNTLAEDQVDSHKDALLMIYTRLRPGNPPQLERAKTLFKEKFYDENRYRLGKVGRFRLSRKFQQDGKTAKDVPDESIMTLEPADMVNIIRYILHLRAGEGVVDDIDHLGNRRLRTIDELAGDEIRKGFLKLRRTVQERVSLKEPEELAKIAELVNSKSVSASIEYFFGRSELSQVVDQTNPLSQLTHERRLSALGPGGLNRKRAGFEVRDVHISHYGRICPIETPEGNNIGLISSLALFAAVDEFGFLITPYQRVRNGRLTDDVQWLRADEESEAILAPPDVLKDDDNERPTAAPGRSKRKIPEGPVLVRAKSEVSQTPSEDIEYLDVSPKQTVGISAALIPFLEHDDANRALMGSNMQRQAVPLIRTEPPIIATGLERFVAADSGMVVRAQRPGTVTYADAQRIVIDNVDEYELRKFARLNERTCLNQKPIVKTGQRVRKNEIIADGPACSNGELALGRNILVAFVPFDGYNFEDAILISEKLVKNDVFTSIHIEDYDVEVRETKLGKEEFTRDIPNVSERALRNLDAAGIVSLGTRVKPGDILVGKVAPKSKSELTPEEKLLHAIFGRAGEDVKNDSLELPAGEEGIVVAAKRFSRRVQMSDERKKALNKEMKQYGAGMNEKTIAVFRKMCEEINEVLGSSMVDPSTRQKVGQSEAAAIILEQIEDFTTKWFKGKSADRERAEVIYRRYWPTIEKIDREKERKLAHMKRGDELPSGVLEMVKVYVVTKRKLAVGDKMAGRHGNKGVIARIMPEEDMPFLADGTPVDICLNPLGVPSRMNVGQILETHLGWAAAVLGFQAVTPVFDGATETEITQAIEQANEHVRQRGTVELPHLRGDELREIAKQLAADREQWFKDFKSKANRDRWHDLYINNVVGSFKFLVTQDDPGNRLNPTELKLLEDALIFSYPDNRPRPFKGIKSAYMPRFNNERWRKEWENDPEGAKRKVLAAIEENPKLKSAYLAAKGLIDGSSGWIPCIEESLADVPKKQGVYFFRNNETGRVNEGYIGLSGKEPDKGNLRERLGEHIRGGDEYYDNLLPRYADEEAYLIESYPNSLKAMENIQKAGATGELLAEMPLDGKTIIYDGRTGEPFEQKVTVGYMYMNKLHHLVDDKIHARSTGPYSLITQQPLGGKARTGGQRFGEMEVWALESYGASYMLQEMLTVKSDDVEGRTKIYESMVKGVNTLDAGTPVSFDVLCNELRGLGLNIQLEKKSLI